MHRKATRFGSLALLSGVLTIAALLPLPSKGAPTRAARPAVKTLVTIRGPVERFVQDGQHVAWANEDGVVIRRLGTRRRSAFYSQGVYDLALAGRQALWLHVQCGMGCYFNVSSAALGERRVKAVTGEFYIEYGGSGSGTRPVAAAAKGDMQLFSLVRYSYRDPDAERGLYMSGGSIQRIKGATGETFLEIPAELLTTDGGRVLAVPLPATGAAENTEPAWSPDGRKIAFASMREGPDSEIETVAPDGTGRSKVTDNFTYDGHPSWAPDGSSLALSTGGSIRIVAADGTRQRTLTSCDEGCYDPDWAPDGSRIVFVQTAETGSHISLVNADGSGKAQLSQTGGDPTWSPDGRHIAFTNWAENTNGIYLVDADGTNERRLTEGFMPTFSPDGQAIAFSKYGTDSDPDLELYTINVDGTGLRQLTDNFVHDSMPDWSPDGGKIAFARTAGGVEEIYAMNADGSGQTRMTETKSGVVTRFPAEVHSATDGTLLSRFMPSGEPLAVAVTPRVAALLVRQGKNRRIELYVPTSGARLRSLRVPRTAASVSAVNQTIVFRSGRTVWAVNAASGKQRVLAVAKSTPIGLSIDGRRVAWAESGKKRSYIRAVLLGAG